MTHVEEIYLAQV